MSINNDPLAPDLSSLLPPPTTDDQTDVVTFKTIGKGGGEVGNLLFEDTIADAEDPNSALAILKEYQMPLMDGESLQSFQVRVLRDLKSDDPQIIPDATLITSKKSGGDINAEFASFIGLSANTPPFPLASSVAAVRSVYGEDFVKIASSRGTDPVAFINQANHAATGIAADARFRALSHTERVRLLFKLLVAVTNENGSAGSSAALSIGLPEDKQLNSSIMNKILSDFMNQIKETSNKTNPNEASDPTQTTTGTQLSAPSNAQSLDASGSKVVDLQTGALVLGNPWLQGTALVAFAVSFLDVVSKLMKNKNAEAKLDQLTRHMTISLSENLAKIQKKIAHIAHKTAVMAIVAGSCTIGLAVISCGAGMRAGMKNEAIPEEPRYVANKSTSPGGLATKEDIAAADKANNDMAAADTKVSVAKNNAQVAKENEMQAIQELKVGEEKAAARARAGKSSTQDEIDSLADSRTKVTKAKQERHDAEGEYITSQEASINKKAELDKDSRFHMQTKDEFDQDVHAAKLKNKQYENQRTNWSAMTMNTTQISGILTNSMAAETSEESGKLKAAQHSLEGLQKIIESVQAKVTAMFKASSDDIATFLQALKELEQAVARAQAELIH